MSRQVKTLFRGPNLPHGISKAGSRYSLLLIGLKNFFVVMGLDLAAYIVLNRLP